MRALSEKFYRKSTLNTARALLGKILVKEGAGEPVSGIIVETEAYLGAGDPASHACRGATPRSRIMFGPPGRAYVYFCYGAHYLLNVVTEKTGRPGAVLIRSAIILKPGPGNEEPGEERELIEGPGRLTRAFKIDLSWNGWDLTRGEKLFISPGIAVRDRDVAAVPRVGISRGRSRPWRFVRSSAVKKPR